MSVPALAYATIKNTVKDPTTLTYFQQNLNVDALPPGGTSTFSTDLQGGLKTLDKILDKTQQKRACCLGQNNVSVRIPQPNITISGLPAVVAVMDKYGYYDRPNVTMPPSPAGVTGFCADLDGDGQLYAPNNAKCNNFSMVYCKNMVQQYQNQAQSGEFDYGEFAYYKPECQCFTPIPQWVIQATNNSGIIPRCILPGCDPGSANLFLDPASQSNIQCSNLCAILTSVEDVQAGGNIQISIDNKCQSSEDQPPPTPPNFPHIPGLPSLPNLSTPTGIETLISIVGSSCGLLIICCILMLIILIFRKSQTT